MRPKTEQEIKLMREAGKTLARILQTLSDAVEPGITPTELSALAAKQLKKTGMHPVLLGYQGYPDIICISINDAVVHGIPGKVPIKDGDVVKLDFTISHKGMVVDAATTIFAGSKNTPADIKRLLDGTKRALYAGIDAIHGDGTRVGDIASAIQAVLDKHKLGIVRDLVGHGVGYGVHEDPNIPNYGVAGTGPMLSAGSTIAVEPMATLGSWQVNMLNDGWTVVTRDGSMAAHFEHTVLITDDAAEILTSL